MTMKMISNTSITSTMGVTLMSDTGGGAVFFSILKLLIGCGVQVVDKPSTGTPRQNSTRLPQTT
jgi:hypothetical protein